MKTGTLIKELRIKKGLTQEELADKTELSARTIQRIENGEVDPRAYSLQMIAKALDVDFSLFVEDESTEDKEKKAKDDRFILGLLHLSGLLLIFIPTILIWTIEKKKVEGIKKHFNDVMGLQLSIWIISIIPGIGMYFFLSINNFINNAHYFILIGVIIGSLFSIMNTINVMNNRTYKRFSFLKSKKIEK